MKNVLKTVTNAQTYSSAQHVLPASKSRRSALVVKPFQLADKFVVMAEDLNKPAMMEILLTETGVAANVALKKIGPVQEEHQSEEAVAQILSQSAPSLKLKDLSTY